MTQTEQAEQIELHRIGTAEEMSLYRGSDGLNYSIRLVNRDYRGTQRAPVYYLLAGQPGQKPVYVSGLFETGRAGELSGDRKDPIGIRRRFVLRIADGGETATIQPVAPRRPKVPEKSQKEAYGNKQMESVLKPVEECATI